MLIEEIYSELIYTNRLNLPEVLHMCLFYNKMLTTSYMLKMPRPTDAPW